MLSLEHTCPSVEQTPPVLWWCRLVCWAGVWQHNSAEPSPTYHHCSPLPCLSPDFLLRFNQCWRFPVTSSSGAKGGVSTASDRWLPLWVAPVLLGDVRDRQPMPLCCSGAEESVSLFWGAKCLKSRFWWKIKAQHKEPALTRVFPTGTTEMFLP